jgi:hypothetical protein
VGSWQVPKACTAVVVDDLSWQALWNPICFFIDCFFAILKLYKKEIHVEKMLFLHSFLNFDVLRI